jgi:hypothetical protein
VRPTGNFHHDAWTLRFLVQELQMRYDESTVREHTTWGLALTAHWGLTVRGFRAWAGQ